jgi:4-carboxymuconolactone decarboxylase
MKKKTDIPKPPKFYQQFVKRYPDVTKSYEALGDTIHNLGPLNDRERALVKLAISGSNLYSSAFKAHIRKAVASGITRDEIEHLILLFLPTVGFPSMMAAMGILDEQMAKN